MSVLKSDTNMDNLSYGAEFVSEKSTFALFVEGS